MTKPVIERVSALNNVKIRGVFARWKRTDNSRIGGCTEEKRLEFSDRSKSEFKSVEGDGAPEKGSTLKRSTYCKPSYIIMSSLPRHRGGWDKKIVALKRGLELGMNLMDTAEKNQTGDVAIL